MKILLISLLLFSSLAAQDSASVLISWDYNQEVDIDSYLLFWGENSGSYQDSLQVGNTNRYWLNNLKPFTTYYFSLKAVNIAGLKSQFSLEDSIKTKSPLKSDFDNNGRVELADLSFFVSQWALRVY